MVGTQLGWAQYDRHPTGRVPVMLVPNWDGPNMAGTQLGGSHHGGHPTGRVPV